MRPKTETVNILNRYGLYKNQFGLQVLFNFRHNDFRDENIN